MAELLMHGVGNVAAEPKLNHIGEKKTAVCNVNLAFNRSFKNRDGDFQKDTCFLWAKFWGNKAEYVANHAKIGSPIYVSGYMQMTKGDKGNFYSIVVNNFNFCEKNGDNKKSSKPTASVKDDSNDDDDLPF